MTTVAVLALGTASAGTASAGEGWIEVHGRYVLTTCASGGPVWCDDWTDSSPRWGFGKRIPAVDGRSVTMLSGWCTTDWTDGEHAEMCS